MSGHSYNRKHSPGIAHPAPVLGATLFALCGVAMAQQPESPTSATTAATAAAPADASTEEKKKDRKSVV